MTNTDLTTTQILLLNDARVHVEALSIEQVEVLSNGIESVLAAAWNNTQSRERGFQGTMGMVIVGMLGGAHEVIDLHFLNEIVDLIEEGRQAQEDDRRERGERARQNMRDRGEVRLAAQTV